MSANMNTALWTQKIAEFYFPGEEKLEEGYEPEKMKEARVPLTRMAEEYIRNYDSVNGTKYEAEIAAAGKEDTFYKILKKNSLLNLVLMMGGYATPKDVLEVVKQGHREGAEEYDYVRGGTIEVVTDFEKFTKDIRQVHKDGLVGSGITMPTEKDAKVIDTMLKDTGLPSIYEILSKMNQVDQLQKAREEAEKTLNSETRKFKRELTKIREKATEAAVSNVPVEFEATQDIPQGTLTEKKANDLFDGVRFDKDFMVPAFEWEGPHPLVPAIDEHYIFRHKELKRVLFALKTNQRAYLQGDTGTGKTTLLEQVAARLNFPFIRINFDSEITRADLIGQHVLETDDNGNTVSRFVEGLLPQAMAMPCIACFDEMDFIRPDVAYVFQAATEGNGLKLMEDGGREVRPHPMFRMFATGNTVGQGDEEGRYQGARPQSLALLDRFTIWLKIDYLDAKQRESLLERHCPMLSDDEKNHVLNYVTEHLEAFKQGKVHQPLSPRGMLAIGTATQFFSNVKEAISMCVLHRATNDDRATLTEIVNRVIA